MAIFVPGASDCPLCDRVIEETDLRFATSDAPLGGGFEQYSDSVFHLDCVARWAHRSAFARAIFESERECIATNEFWIVVHDDDDVFVSVNDDADVARADVTLAATGSVVEVAIADWARWLRGEGPPEPEHDLEAVALNHVKSRLAAVLPTGEAVFEAARAAKRARGW